MSDYERKVGWGENQDSKTLSKKKETGEKQKKKRRKKNL